MIKIVWKHGVKKQKSYEYWGKNLNPTKNLVLKVRVWIKKEVQKIKINLKQGGLLIIKGGASSTPWSI